MAYRIFKLYSGIDHNLNKVYKLSTILDTTMDSEIVYRGWFKGTRARAIIIVAAALLALAGAVLTLHAQSANDQVLYIGWVTSTPYESMSTYNPNLFAGSLGGAFYGLVYAYSAVLNVTSGQMIPALVVNWTISPPNWQQVWKTQPINITITVRKGSGWADGAPVTAYDLLATELVLEAFYPSPPFANYTVINNYTFVITMPPGTFSPYLLPLSLLNTVGIGGVAVIIPYHLWKPVIQQILENLTQIQKLNSTVILAFKKLISEYRPSSIAGEYSGPFYVCGITPSEIVLCKNPYYYAADRIKFDKVIIYQFTSPQTLIAYLKSCSIDLLYSGEASVPSSVLSSLPSCYEVINVPEPFGWALAFNFKNPWLRMLQVRQAIAYVLNRTAIALAGGIKYTPVAVPNGIPNFTYYQMFMTPLVQNLNTYPTNWTKAAELLESVGFTEKNGIWYTPNGSEFTLTIAVSGSVSPGMQNMLNVITDELTKFGIPTHWILITSLTQWHNMWMTGQGYDIWFENWGGYYPGTVDWFLPLGYFGGYPWNVTQWDLIATLPNGTSYNLRQLYLETVSPTSIQQLITANDIIAYVMNQYLPILPLVETSYQVIVNKDRLSVPPPSSPLWYETLTGVGGTAFLQVAMDNGYIQPTVPVTTTTSTVTTTSSVTSTMTTTTTVTSTTTLVSTVTVTKPVVSTTLVVAIVIIVIVVAAIAAIIAMRRR